VNTASFGAVRDAVHAVLAAELAERHGFANVYDGVADAPPVYASADAFERDVVLLLLMGKGQSAAPAWVTPVVVHVGEKVGAMFEYVERAQRRGWGVVIANPNLNARLVTLDDNDDDNDDDDDDDDDDGDGDGADFGDPPAEHVRDGAMQLELELVRVQSAPMAWEMDDAQRVAAAVARKQRGNTFFGRKRYDLALHKYEKALSYVDRMQQRTLGDTNIGDLRVALHINAAACIIKLQDSAQIEHTKVLNTKPRPPPHMRPPGAPDDEDDDTATVRGPTLAKAIEHCTSALALAPDHAKALYRRGVARKGHGEWRDALADLQRAVQLDPKSKAARTELAAVRELLREQKRDAKQTYAGMFDKMLDADAQRETKRRRELAAKRQQQHTGGAAAAADDA